MRKHKGLFAVLLCAALTVSLFAGMAPYAAAEGSFTRAELERIVSESAIAYYLKGPDCQYDSHTLAGLYRMRSAVTRQTLCRSPEDCTPQKRYYTVCSSYPHDVYYSTFGTHPLLQEDMVGTEFPTVATVENRLGLVTGSRTDEELEYPLALISLTSHFCAYGKKVAQIGDTEQYESGWIGHDGMAFFWGDNSFENVTDEQVEMLRQYMRPGDIISVVRGGEDDEDGENSGHTMVFLGDYKGDGVTYIIHSGGSKYNNADSNFEGSEYKSKNNGAIRSGVWTVTGQPSGAYALGFDIVEHYSEQTRNGTIRITPFDELFLRGKTYGPNQRTGDSVIKQFAVMRPIDRLTGWSGAMTDVSDNDAFPKTLTPSAYARAAYPGLEITTLADKTEYNDVQAGGTLTYTVMVENDTDIASMKPRYGENGTDYENLTLTLPLPKNAVYVSTELTDTAAASVPGTASYDAAAHTVTVRGFTSAAGAKYCANVTVEIPAGTRLGTKLELPGGRMTGPETDGYFALSGMTHVVGGAHPAGFDTITSASVTPTAARGKMGAANDVYAAAGYRLELPDTKTLLNSVLTYTFQGLESSRRMQSRILDPEEITDPDALRLRKMLVPNYWGGHKLYTVNAAGVKTNRNRMLDFNEDYLQPGDILVYAYTGTVAESSGRGIVTSTPTAERVYVYLGNSDYAFCDDDGVFQVLHAPLQTFGYSNAKAAGVMTNFDRNGNTPATKPRVEWSAVLTQAFRYSYFLCLRPSLAYETLPTMTPSASVACTVENGGATAGYASFAEAAAAANANPGSILTLHEDTALAANETLAGGTLDLGGHTLTTGSCTLTLGAAQTLRSGTVTGSVSCAGPAAIRDAEIFASGTALLAADDAHVELSGVLLASANTAELPLRTASGAPLANWTFLDDVTVLVPTALAPFDGNGAALGEGVVCCGYGRNAWYQIAGAEDASTYQPVIFTKSFAVRNETTGENYPTFGIALTKASAGDTLRLLRDVHTADLREIGTSLNYGRQVNPTSSNRRYANYVAKSLTVDFDGHTLTVDSSGVNSAGFYLSGSAVEVTFRNGTITAKNGWALNTAIRAMHLDNMKIYGYTDAAIILSDASRTARSILLENGTVVVGGLGGNSGTSSTSNNAIVLRYGDLIVRGGSKVGSLTGLGIRPASANATAEKPNVCSVTVEDGTLFTGRYAYLNADSDYGCYYTGYDHSIIGSTLSFLADTDAQYLRQEHQEEVLEIPGSTTIVAADRSVKLGEAVKLDASYSLNLNDRIVLNYYAADEENAYTDESYALVDGEKLQMVKEGGNRYLAVRESAAKEMGAESTVKPVVFDAAGAAHPGQTAALSIRGYAETVLGATDWEKSDEAKLGRAMIALLDYGAEAQKYFGFETNDLANRNLTDGDHARMKYTRDGIGSYRADKRTVNDPEGLYAASSCVLGSSQALRFYLNLPENRTDRESLGFRVDYRGYKGDKRVFSRSFAELTETELPGVYYFEAPELRAADVLTAVTLTVEKDGSTLACVTDSVASYCARVQLERPETAALADALLIYGLSAQEHFGMPAPAAEENELPVN